MWSPIVIHQNTSVIKTKIKSLFTFFLLRGYKIFLIYYNHTVSYDFTLKNRLVSTKIRVLENDLAGSHQFERFIDDILCTCLIVILHCSHRDKERISLNNSLE